MLSNYANNSMNVAQNMTTTYYDALEAALSEVFNQFSLDCEASESSQAMIAQPKALSIRKTTIGYLSLLSDTQCGSPVKQTNTKTKKIRKIYLPNVA